MRVAVIDLGTNTFDLIIVDRDETTNKFSVLYTDKSFVSLGEGGINEKRITKSATERAVFTIEHFFQACREYEVKTSNIYAFGTSALRDAKNTDEFSKTIQSSFGINIKVIDGNSEAKMIYEGVNGIHSFTEPSCIMDIGGGSTEFIFANSSGYDEVISLNIGVSRILQLFDIPGRIDSIKKQEIVSFMEDAEDGLFSRYHNETLIGAAGSFETFYQLVTENTSYDDFSTHEIPFDGLIKVLEGLIASDLEEREQNFWIPNYRNRMIHIAALQTLWVIEKQKISRCVFSPAALKEGVLFSSV
tara:strand:+ start:15509 stop:16414 length:906 start_codon:yes stop_codon:yes gene_type:complete